MINRMDAVLSILLLFSNPAEFPELADCIIEYNTFLDSSYEENQQVIFRNPKGEILEWYFFVRKFTPREFPDGRGLVVWRIGDEVKRFSGKIIFTRTTYDPEACERNILPAEFRRGIPGRPISK